MRISPSSSRSNRRDFVSSFPPRFSLSLARLSSVKIHVSRYAERRERVVSLLRSMLHAAFYRLIHLSGEGRGSEKVGGARRDVGVSLDVGGNGYTGRMKRVKEREKERRLRNSLLVIPFVRKRSVGWRKLARSRASHFYARCLPSTRFVAF